MEKKKSQLKYLAAASWCWILVLITSPVCGNWVHMIFCTESWLENLNIWY